MHDRNTDYLKKRQLIEQGELRYWTKRGLGSYNSKRYKSFKMMVQAGAWVTGLRYFGHRNVYQLTLRKLCFRLKRLPAAFSGFKILHLSDFHADGLPHLPRTVCNLVGNVEVDLCVLTGDYRWRQYGSSDLVYPAMKEIIGCLRSRRGIYGILGNHDSVEKVPEFERMGMDMLVNRAVPLDEAGERIWLLGLDDPHYYGCDDLDGALAQVGDDDAFKILLVHTPELARDAADAHVDLYLCGHTHGGQVRLPGLKPLVANSNADIEFVSGPWRCNGMMGYTTAGVGCSLAPIRFFCPPEIALIELRHPDDPEHDYPIVQD